MTAQLGDALICTPLIHAARQQWPQARIDVLGFEGTLDLLAGNPDVSTLIEVARRGNLQAHWRDLRRLWRRYDLALVTRTSDRAHLYGLVAARVRSALLPGGADEGRWKRRLTRHGFAAATGLLLH